MTQAQFPCQTCGAALAFKPGTDVLVCEYCGAENRIPRSEEDIREIDFHTVLSALEHQETSAPTATVTCQNCNAEFTLAPTVHADECPFCASSVVTEPQQHSYLKPRALLPFKLSEKEAQGRFGHWLQGLWFAPAKVKAYARRDDSFTGIYVPYWTYDSATVSFYRGQRGVDREYKGADGKTKTKTDWTQVSGTVWRNFDDVLVLASRSLPENQARQLKNWDLANLVPYSEEYLSGFRAETYHIDVRQGFEMAKKIMDERIRDDVKDDIGGDSRRIDKITNEYNNITFKHVLLPLYLAAYRYKDKAYRFVINARTGDVQGERPYSPLKIGLAIVGVVAVIAVIAFLLSSR